MDTRTAERWTMFSVGIPSDPNALRTLFSLIKVNVIGFNLVTVGNYWNVNFVPETTDTGVLAQLRTLLTSRGYSVSYNDVYGVVIPNSPQSLYNSILVPFADRGILSNVIISSASSDNSTRLFFSVSENPDLALEVLSQIRSTVSVA